MNENEENETIGILDEVSQPQETDQPQGADQPQAPIDLGFYWKEFLRPAQGRVERITQDLINAKKGVAELASSWQSNIIERLKAGQSTGDPRAVPLNSNQLHLNDFRLQ